MPAARHTMLHSSDTRDEYLSAIAPPPILPTALAPNSMLKANAALVGVTPCPVMYSARCCWIPVSVCAVKNRPNPNIQNMGVLITSPAVARLCRGASAVDHRTTRANYTLSPHDALPI